MLNSVDIIAILILLYVAFAGWQKGIVRLCVGFFAFILASVVAGIYFSQAHSVINALIIFFVGSFIFSMILSKGLSSWNKKVCDGKPPFFLSKLLGAALISAWMGSLIGLTLFAISVFPVKTPLFQDIKNAVLNSHSYALIEKHVFKEVPALESLSLLVSLSENADEGEGSQKIPLSEEQIQEIRSSKEFKTIYESEAVQSMLQDEELMEKIQSRDIAGIISDPKTQALLQDKELIENLQSLYGELLEQGVPQSLLQEPLSEF